MPLFEFVCNDCQRPFEELVRSASAVVEVVCPHCGSPQVRKKLSTFAARIGGSVSLSTGGAAACSTGGT
jgi:putative FmdB family regulatory protein